MLFILGSAELYDPNTETWSITGGLTTRARKAQQPYNARTATSVDRRRRTFWLNAAELYNPATGVGQHRSLLRFRTSETATLLPIARYWSWEGKRRKSSQNCGVVRPATGKWTTLPGLTRPDTLTRRRYLDGRCGRRGMTEGPAAITCGRGAYDRNARPCPNCSKIIKASVSGKNLL